MSKSSIAGRTAPWLVPRTGVTSSSKLISAPQPLPSWSDAGWLKGVCVEHGAERWAKISCKRRTCPVCGQIRREKIAWRITKGIETVGGDDGAGWHVLTFDVDVLKAKAVRISNQYIQWLTRNLKRVWGLKMEWAKVWERHKNGRLHLNLLCVPWRFIPHKTLWQKWHSFGGGIHAWISRVGAGIGVEAAKSRYKMGLYLAKYDQMVLSGRGVSYSKGFPKLPREPGMLRKGEIAWRFVGSFSQEGIMHWYETELGYWNEVGVDEWGSADGEQCHCFEFQASAYSKARHKIAAARNLWKGGDG